jgi:hypothetical protein
MGQAFPVPGDGGPAHSIGANTIHPTGPMTGTAGATPPPLPGNTDTAGLRPAR